MTPPRHPDPTDLTGVEWQLLPSLIPDAKPGGRPLIHDRRTGPAVGSAEFDT